MGGEVSLSMSQWLEYIGTFANVGEAFQSHVASVMYVLAGYVLHELISLRSHRCEGLRYGSRGVCDVGVSRKSSSHLQQLKNLAVQDDTTWTA